LYRLFFLEDHPAFYIAAAAAAFAVAWHPAAILFALPYLFRAGKNLHWSPSAIQLVKGAVQLLLITIQHVVASIALLYGSVRFRSLVL
jgi:hypothetical protein